MCGLKVYCLSACARAAFTRLLRSCAWRNSRSPACRRGIHHTPVTTSHTQPARRRASHLGWHVRVAIAAHAASTSRRTHTAGRRRAGTRHSGWRRCCSRTSGGGPRPRWRCRRGDRCASGVDGSGSRHGVRGTKGVDLGVARHGHRGWEQRMEMRLGP